MRYVNKRPATPHVDLPPRLPPLAVRTQFENERKYYKVPNIDDDSTRESVKEQEAGGRHFSNPSLAQRLKQIHEKLNELTSSPASHDIIELAMATVTSLDICQKDDSPFVWLIVVGPPGSDKTQSVLSLRACENTQFLDALTVNCFASGYVNDKTGSTAKSLLPELDGKCLIIKDLTTLFSQRSENVQKILGDLQSIYDGAYSKATGTIGILSYESQFTILACITPQALSKHQQYMSAIGGRFMFYQIPELTEGQMEKGFDIVWNSEHRKAHVKALKDLVVEHVLDVCTASHKFARETPEQQETISRLASFMAAGRSVLTYTKPGGPEEGSGGGGRERLNKQTEQPWRGTYQLRNLARALARIHGRTRITNHEIDMLRRVVLSSIHEKWGRVLWLFQQWQEGFTPLQCAGKLGFSPKWAGTLLNDLWFVGIVEPNPALEGNVFQAKLQYREFLTQPYDGIDHISDLG